MHARSFQLCLTLWTLWTVACQAPLSWASPGKNTGVGCHFLLQGIFPTQGLNLCLRHWQVDSLPLSHLGSPFIPNIVNIYLLNKHKNTVVAEY